jgi:hypothetical protein
MIRICDSNYREFIESYPRGVLPRITRYGDADAKGKPVENTTVKLYDPSDYKEVITRCHEQKSFPMYWQKRTWAPDGFRWNQNGIGYCWTWSGTAGMMDLRAIEGKDTVRLAPVSMGFLVNWADRGNYLESYIEGAQEIGVAPASYMPGEDINSHDRNYRNYKDGWKDARGSYRLGEVWDTDTRNGDARTIQHCLSILAYGRPLYIAYSWWGHALECIGLLWDETKKNNLVWVIRNSHNETKPIYLDGNRGVPDEAYGFASTEFAD